MTEVLGAHTHLHVDVGGRRLIAAVPSGLLPTPGHDVTLSMDLRRLHLFAADGSPLLPHSHQAGTGADRRGPELET